MNVGDEELRLYSVPQLAELWGLSESYIYDEIREKRLPVLRLGRGDRNKMRVSAKDAKAWLQARHSGPALRSVS